ncbi:MAG: flavodoxin family protein [Firmicutes bacterium]|nr:flavodoxin family protein [Bacillota bacterium]
MKRVRIVGLSSSPRHANTEILVQESLTSARETVEGLVPGMTAETEYISLHGKKIQPCLDCGGCVRSRSYCILKDDWLETVKRLTDPVPNGLIIGSPVYFFSTNSKLRAFIERFTCLVKKVWIPDHGVAVPDWSKTAAGALAVGFHRNGGQEHVVADILRFLLISGFVTVGGFSLAQGPVGYIGGVGWAHERGNDVVRHDDFGLNSVRILGENVGRTAALLALGEWKLSELGGSTDGGANHDKG